MMKYFKLFTILLLISVSTVLSKSRTKREEHYVALSEIDRPLNVGQRQQVLSAGNGAYFSYNKKSKHTDAQNFFFIPNFNSPTFEFGISDTLSLQFYGILPSIQYLFVNNIKIEDGISYITGPNIAFIAGINSLNWSCIFDKGDQFQIGLNLALSGKYPINKRLWFTNSVNANFGTTSFISGATHIGLGIQISKRVSMHPCISGRVGINASTHDIYAGGSISDSFKFNINEHLSFEIYGSATQHYDEEYSNVKDYIYGTASSSIIFSW